MKDAVLTVPPFFGQAERRAVMDAAALAEVNVLQVSTPQVWSLTQFYSVDFSKSMISVNKCIF